MDTEELIQKPYGATGCLDAYLQDKINKCSNAMLRFSKALLLIISNAQSSAQILRCFDTKMLKCFHIHPFAEPFEDS